MTASPHTAPDPAALVPVIQGPHSPWPRKTPRRARAAGAAAAATTAAAVLIHCAGPILF